MGNICIIVLISVAGVIVLFGLLVSSLAKRDVFDGIGIHMVFLAFLFLCFLLVVWSYRLQWLREQSKSYCVCSFRLFWKKRRKQNDDLIRKQNGIKVGHRNRQIFLEATGFPAMIRKVRQAVELEGGTETCYRKSSEKHVLPLQTVKFYDTYTLRPDPLNNNQIQTIKRFPSSSTASCPRTAAPTKRDSAIVLQQNQDGSSAAFDDSRMRIQILVESETTNSTNIRKGSDPSSPIPYPGYLNHPSLSKISSAGNSPATDSLQHSATARFGGSGKNGVNSPYSNRSKSSNAQQSMASTKRGPKQQQQQQQRVRGGGGQAGGKQLKNKPTANNKKYMVKNSFANPNRYLHKSTLPNYYSSTSNNNNGGFLMAANASNTINNNNNRMMNIRGTGSVRNDKQQKKLQSPAARSTQIGYRKKENRNPSSTGSSNPSSKTKQIDRRGRFPYPRTTANSSSPSNSKLTGKPFEKNILAA